MKPLIYLYSIIVFILSSANAFSQNKNSYKDIFPHIKLQDSSNDLVVSVVKNDEWLKDPNTFYSIALFRDSCLLDISSLDSISNSGARPKDIFFWETSQKDKYVCLEYYLGSGVGKIINDDTKLMIYSVIDNKLSLTLNIATDSGYYNANNNERYEVSSRIYLDRDTLLIERNGWDAVTDKEENISKINNFNELIKMIYIDKRIKIFRYPCYDSSENCYKYIRSIF